MDAERCWVSHAQPLFRRWGVSGLARLDAWGQGGCPRPEARRSAPRLLGPAVDGTAQGSSPVGAWKARRPGGPWRISSRRPSSLWSRTPRPRGGSGAPCPAGTAPAWTTRPSGGAPSAWRPTDPGSAATRSGGSRPTGPRGWAWSTSGLTRTCGSSPTRAAAPPTAGPSTISGPSCRSTRLLDMHQHEGDEAACSARSTARSPRPPGAGLERWSARLVAAWRRGRRSPPESRRALPRPAPPAVLSRLLERRLLGDAPAHQRGRQQPPRVGGIAPPPVPLPFRTALGSP